MSGLVTGFYFNKKNIESSVRSQWCMSARLIRMNRYGSPDNPGNALVLFNKLLNTTQYLCTMYNTVLYLFCILIKMANMPGSCQLNDGVYLT